MYGTTDTKYGTHIDTSNTLKGAKRYATNNNLKNVSKRTGYIAKVIAIKDGKKWINN